MTWRHCSPRRAPAGSGPPIGGHLFSEGLHSADPALPRRLPLAASSARAPRDLAHRICRWTRRSRSPRQAPGPAAIEAPFTLGDQPERHCVAREALLALGHETTIGYLGRSQSGFTRRPDCCRTSIPRLMTLADLELLRPAAVSAGLMLESVAERLCDPGGPALRLPGQASPDPLEMIRTAGELPRTVHQRHPDRHRRDAARAHRILLSRAHCMPGTIICRRSSSRTSAPSRAPPWLTRGAVAGRASVDHRARAPWCSRRP